MFREHFKALTIYAKRYVQDLDSAQDITQEVFVRLYEKRSTLEIHTSLKAFLYTAVRNRCLDALRSNKTHQLHKEQIKSQTEEITSFTIDQDEQLIEQTALQQKLYNAINELPEQNQKIFRLSRLEGKTNQEIADQLHLTKRTVETHISNALKKLRKIITLILLLIYSVL